MPVEPIITTEVTYSELYTEALHAHLLELGCTGRIERITAEDDCALTVVAERPGKGLVILMKAGDGSTLGVSVGPDYGLCLVDALIHCLPAKAVQEHALQALRAGWVEPT